MRKTLVTIGLTVVGFIAVWRYQPAAQQQPGPGSAPPPGPPTTGAPAPSTDPGAPATTVPGAPPTGGPGGQRTAAGEAVDMPYGTVQVQATVSGSRLTDVTVLQAPTDGRSGRIAAESLPVLRQEALQAQSAQIDTVSGATYTSQAYAQSLQAALDAARR